MWGLWSLGTRAYYSGYYTYSNPYYVETPVVVEVPAVDYSQPINVTADFEAEPADGGDFASPEPESPEFEAAMDSFQSGDYDSALSRIDAALKKLPNDAALHEFRALVLFAKREFTQAAAAVHAVLAVGPGWDWTTLSSLYPDDNAYTSQLRSLEAYRKENPQDAAAHFLLAYHYLTCGHLEAATKELEKVVEIIPSDEVAVRLLQTFQQGDESTTPAEPAPADVESPDIAPETVVGNWTSDRGDQGKIELNLGQDNKFTWKYTGPSSTEEFSGTYSVGGNILTLIDTNGQPMVGNLTQVDGGFNFRLTGGDPNDPGITFGA